MNIPIFRVESLYDLEYVVFLKWVTPNSQANSAKRRSRSCMHASSKSTKTTPVTSTPTKSSTSPSSTKTLSSKELSPSSIKTKTEKSHSVSSSQVPPNPNRSGLALRNRWVAQAEVRVQDLWYWWGWVHNERVAVYSAQDDGGQQFDRFAVAAACRPHHNQGRFGKNATILGLWWENFVWGVQGHGQGSRRRWKA